MSRRALMFGLAGAPLAACSPLPVGTHLDEGQFGNPSAHNLMVQTGQLPYVIDLAERFEATVPTTVTFAFDSVALDAPARAALLAQARFIRHFPEVTFRVFGHTDLVGSAAYNRRLGLRRARAVVNFLVRNGASRSRLEALVSEGETQPRVRTTDRERLNRRTVTEVSGFWQSHPTVMNGEYAAILHREYVQSASYEM
ncbi:hypothetical protein DDE20_08330 [Pararhodobacter oceanensis]|uniref:OmpA-like domain-containing protein n=1 Tax=Pararhodobacter oceanensis TaxID=2172121 RepID=A0A2T8HV77_9RHOB|nr:OmpA family protein [Pararhodobacter oceanensis]PVH29353.1 hypothetical protein DDE20_08330 [Pararhodobacter oceanensis]